MKRLFLVLMMVACAGGAALAQFRSAANPNRAPKRSGNGESLFDKLYLGGGGGFGAGTSGGARYTYYALFPMIGYRITPQFLVGTGFNYQHYGYPDFGLSLNQYGVAPFLRYTFNNQDDSQTPKFNGVFFQTSYEYISSPTVNYFTGKVENGRQWFSRLLFGVGYSQPIGRRSALNAMVMYDVLYKQPSVFSSPILVRVFFSI